MKTLVICDSRGLALPTILNNANYDGEIKVASNKGTGYRVAVTRAREIILSYRPTNVIICVGICDVTIRGKKTKITDFRYPTVIQTVEHVIEEMNQAWNEPNRIGIKQISFATVTGLDLHRYNKSGNNDTRDQTIVEEVKKKQDVLNQAILDINRRIVEKNKINGTPTTWTAGYVHRYFRKHYHHYYNRLQDGCHLSKKAANYWVDQIVKTSMQLTTKTL